MCVHAFCMHRCSGCNTRLATTTTIGWHEEPPPLATSQRLHGPRSLPAWVSPRALASCSAPPNDGTRPAQPRPKARQAQLQGEMAG